MLYMVIERPRDRDAVGTRFREHGRLMPDGLAYVASWLTPDGRTCYQVMDSPRRELLDEWIRNWSDLVDFEVHEVETSAAYWSRVNAR